MSEWRMGTVILKAVEVIAGPSLRRVYNQKTLSF
jgi:hypothetical protein